MAYYTIDLDALKSMVSEYENLSKILEEEAGVTSMEVNMLTSGSWLGEDATFVCDNVNNNSEQMLTIRDNIQLLINELNKGLSNFQEAKKYANEFNSIFDDSYVSKSPEDICGKLLCDEEEIETLKTYNINISDLQVSMSESVEKAKVYLSSLNRPQTEIEEEINIFKKEIDELKKFGLYAFALEHYREMVEQADTELQSGLSTLVSDLGPQVDSVLNSENHSYEADILALLISRDNLTTDQLSLLNKLMPRILANEEDMLYIIESIGNGEWTDYQVKFIAEVYKSAVNNSDTELCTIIYNELYIYENGIGGFDRIKIGRVDLYLDPENDGKAFYTLQRAANVMLCNEITDIRVEWDEDIEDMVLCFSTKHDLNWNGPGIASFTGKLSFVDMNELISDEAKDNLINSMGFSNDEYVEYLSSICSDRDIELVCDLAECSIGDIAAYEAVFSKDPTRLTVASSTALADYSYHLGTFGTDEFSNNIIDFSNAMLCKNNIPVFFNYSTNIAGHTYKQTLWTKSRASYAKVYFDIWELGCELRADAAKEIYAESLNLESSTYHDEKKAIESIVATENIMLYRDIPVADRYKNFRFTNLCIANTTSIFVDGEYQYITERYESEPVQISAEISISDDMSKLAEYKQKEKYVINQWNRDMFIPRMTYAGVRTASGIVKPGSEYLVDFAKDIIIDSSDVSKLSSAYYATNGISDIMGNMDSSNGVITLKAVDKIYPGKVTFIPDVVVDRQVIPIVDEISDKKIDSAIAKVNVGIKGAAIAYDAIVKDAQYRQEYDEFKIDESLDSCGSYIVIVIDDSRVSTTEPKVVYMDMKDTCSVEGALFSEDVKNGYLSRGFSDRDMEKCIEYFDTVKDIYDSEVYDIAYGIVFGGIDMQQTIANVDVTIWNEAQELANNALSAVGQSTLVSQKSEYSKHFRENLN